MFTLQVTGDVFGYDSWVEPIEKTDLRELVATEKLETSIMAVFCCLMHAELARDNEENRYAFANPRDIAPTEGGLKWEVNSLATTMATGHVEGRWTFAPFNHGAIRLFWEKIGMRDPTDKIKFKRIKIPQQPGQEESGFYVMMTMVYIIRKRLGNLPSPLICKRTYRDEELLLVKDIVAQWALDVFDVTIR
ncbi:hypothetical protein ACFE04_021641 [Oxalis oulophora]